MKNAVDIYRIPGSWMNLGEGKKFYLEIMEAALGVLISFPILMIAVFASERNMADVYKLLELIPFLAAVMLARRKVKRDIIYYTLCIAMFFIVIYVMPKLSMKIGTALYYIIYAIESFKKRNSGVKSYYTEEFIAFGNIILLIQYVICINFSLYEFQPIILFDSIVFSLMFVVYIFIARAKKLMEWERQTSREAINRINASCRNVVFFLTAFYGLLSVIFYASGMFDIQKSFYGFHMHAYKGNASNGAGGNMQNMNLNTFSNLNQNRQKPVPQFLRIIVKIVLALIMLMAVLAAAYFIFAALKMLIKKLVEIFFRKKSEDDEKESVLMVPDVRENIRKRIDAFKNIRRFYGSGNRGRVRKMYCRFVVSRLKNIKRSDTPRSIEKKIADADIKSITDIYEKARYGKNDVSNEEMYKMKKLVR